MKIGKNKFCKLERSIYISVMENNKTTGDSNKVATTDRKPSKLVMVRSLASVIKGLETIGWDKKDLEKLTEIKDKLRKEVMNEL